jgi:hypothetical protein
VIGGGVMSLAFVTHCTPCVFLPTVLLLEQIEHLAPLSFWERMGLWAAVIPNLLFYGALGAGVAWGFRRPAKTASSDESPQCQKCGYSLRGNVSGVCPECGRAIAGDAEGSA